MMMRRTLHHLASVVLAVCALLACACEPRAITVPPKTRIGEVTHDYVGSGRTVAVIGDSLTVKAWDGLYRDLAEDHAVKVAAWFGEGFDGGPLSDRFASDMVGAIVAEYAQVPPDVVVLALGTNTVWAGAGRTDDVGLALERQADAVAAFGDACLVGVTLQAEGPANWDSMGAERLNAALGWADQVVDWADAVEADPTLVGSDAVHTSAAGTRVRAELIAEAVRACVT